MGRETKVSCKYCNGELKIEEQIFSNGVKHLKQTCITCGKHNGYAPQDTDFNKFTMPLGKYKGKRLDEIKMQDPDYLRWAAENMHASLQRKIEKYLEL